LVDQFLLGKQVNGASAKTIRIYRFWLTRLAVEIPQSDGLDVLSVTEWFSRRRARPLSQSTDDRPTGGGEGGVPLRGPVPPRGLYRDGPGDGQSRGGADRQ
jgi:hypothetical protein